MSRIMKLWTNYKKYENMFYFWKDKFWVREVLGTVGYNSVLCLKPMEGGSSSGVDLDHYVIVRT
jgi:hypothetical protein